ncbi:tetratricopeptide repeat protein [Niastella caeni]|uniref:Tetratricopeptide repeat protein n=1 Tax=Niastella caeni TaxID=2569763 RepID=A0A4S8HLB5_9BACT|nr:sensor histidine kinase [Niastella caeni]THU36088.1 tetratricopeptide repeat protein [Niastella caeni]
MKLLSPKIPLLILALSFCQASFCQRKIPPIDTVFIRHSLDQATLLFKKSLYDTAINICNDVLRLTEKHNLKLFSATAYDILADIMLTNGKLAGIRKYDSIILTTAVHFKDTNLIINARTREGVYLLEQGKNGEAADNFLYVLDLRLEKEQSIKTAEVYSNMATVYMALSKHNEAMKWFFKTLRLYEKHNHHAGLGETYSNISSLYYLIGRPNDAIEFQKKSIYFREKQNDIQGLIIPQINIGQLYILKDSFSLALDHLKKAVTYSEKINNTKLRAAAYSGMATYYVKAKEFGNALQWQNKSIALFEETDNKVMLSRLYVAAGNLANATNDSVGAVAFFQKGLALSKQLDNKENIGNAYEKMSTFYFSHKDFENAYRYYKIYTTYRDTIATASALTNIEKIKIEYDSEKKDNEILKMVTEQRIKELQIEKQKALIAGNMLEAQKKENEIELLSKAKELQELKIKQQDEELEKQLLLAKNNEQQLQLAAQDKQLQQKQLRNSTLVRNFILGSVLLLAALGYFLFNRYQLRRKIKEQEALLAVRNNIAKDLHDEIGSTLTSIKILSEVSKKNLQHDQAKTSSFLQKITEQSAAVQQGISDIVWAVKPENDKLENMVIRMREYAAQTLESKNVHTVINIDEEVLSKSLDMNQRRDLFLVFKEAVNNIAKYAGATTVQVTLEKINTGLQMQIVDDGCGFDIDKQTSSSGLKNMQARAASLNGKLAIYSLPGKGTSISLRLPTT